MRSQAWGIVAVVGIVTLGGCSAPGVSGPEPRATAGAAMDRTPFDPRTCSSGQSIGLAPPLLVAGASGAASPEEALTGISGVLRSHHGELTPIVIERTATRVVVRYDNATGPVGELVVRRLETGGWAMDGGSECSPT
jgi:hypothetical protein